MMNDRIIQYLKKQTCATICCINQKGKPYCFNVFYGFNSNAGLLYFKSSASSHHAGFLNENPAVAGTILPDKLNKLHVQGIQFEGRILPKDDLLVLQAPGYYHKQNPIALAIPGDVWAIEMSTIKMTDNKLGFGKKVRWEREDIKVEM